MLDKKDNELCYDIAIIGGGFSGTLVAIHLLKKNKNLKVALIEKRLPLGRGLAYRTWDDNFLLNVPAGNMSALADEPGHFVKYCQEVDPAFNAGSFISRRIYGDYLENTLRETILGSASQFQIVHAEALSISAALPAAGYAVELSECNNINAKQVVLALGHFPPKNIFSNLLTEKFPQYLNDPWDYFALGRVSQDKPVALIGSGHTAIDTLFRLTAGNNQLKVFFLSRRGLIPHGHRFLPKPPRAVEFPAYLNLKANTIRSFLRAFRQALKARQAEGDDWRDLINELRPYTALLWSKLNNSERARFLRHLAPYWDIHRHRLAPSAYLRLRSMLESGQVEVVGGRILESNPNDDGVSLVIQSRANGDKRNIEVGSVINCTGPNYDIAQVESALVRQLHQQGLLMQDSLKLGLLVDERYRLLNAAGEASTNLFYIGPMLKASYWEAIAVPELRLHSQKLADALMADLY